jgi:hypothetical protein
MTAAGLYTIPSIENQLGILLPAADKADLVALLKSKNPEDISKPNNHAARLLEILYNAFDCAREAPVFTREKRPLEPAM